MSNYAGGDPVGASWTDKIMNIKSDIPQTPEGNEVADDEWVCVTPYSLLN